MAVEIKGSCQSLKSLGDTKCGIERKSKYYFNPVTVKIKGTNQVVVLDK
jgi:hypothetical protein